jgi:transposase
VFETGEHSTAELADLFGVGRSTVYRAIERQRAKSSAPALAASRG